MKNYSYLFLTCSLFTSAAFGMKPNSNSDSDSSTKKPNDTLVIDTLKKVGMVSNYDNLKEILFKRREIPSGFEEFYKKKYQFSVPRLDVKSFEAQWSLSRMLKKQDFLSKISESDFMDHLKIASEYGNEAAQQKIFQYLSDSEFNNKRTTNFYDLNKAKNFLQFLKTQEVAWAWHEMGLLLLAEHNTKNKTELTINNFAQLPSEIKKEFYLANNRNLYKKYEDHLYKKYEDYKDKSPVFNQPDPMDPKFAKSTIDTIIQEVRESGDARPLLGINFAMKQFPKLKLPKKQMTEMLDLMAELGSVTGIYKQLERVSLQFTEKNIQNTKEEQVVELAQCVKLLMYRGEITSFIYLTNLLSGSAHVRCLIPMDEYLSMTNRFIEYFDKELKKEKGEKFLATLFFDLGILTYRTNSNIAEYYLNESWKLGDLDAFPFMLFSKPDITKEDIEKLTNDAKERNTPGVALGEAMIAECNGNYEGALELLKKAYKDKRLRKETKKPLSEFICNFLFKNKFSSETFNKVMNELNIEHAPTTMQMAVQQIGAGNRTKALETLNKASEQAKKTEVSAHFYNSLGVAYSILGEQEKAKLNIEKAIDKGSEDAMWNKVIMLCVDAEDSDPKTNLARISDIKDLIWRFVSKGATEAIVMMVYICIAECKSDHLESFGDLVFWYELAQNILTDQKDKDALRNSVENHNIEATEYVFSEIICLKDETKILERLRHYMATAPIKPSDSKNPPLLESVEKVPVVSTDKKAIWEIPSKPQEKKPRNNSPKSEKISPKYGQKLFMNSTQKIKEALKEKRENAEKQSTIVKNKSTTLSPKAKEVAHNILNNISSDIDHNDLNILFSDLFFAEQVNISKTKSGIMVIGHNRATGNFKTASTHRKHNSHAKKGANPAFVKELAEILELFGITKSKLD